MDFFARENELKALSELLTKNEYPNAIVYGRRRVGKSEIISKFISDSKCSSVYYQCIKTSNIDNVKCLSDIVCQKFNLKHLSFDTFDSIFMFLLEQANEEKIILVLDEFSYWSDVESGFETVVQRCLDQSKHSNLKVILCGSELSIMENLDKESSPLFGRFSIKMKIEPFDYYDSSNFTSKLSYEDQVKYYCCFGGLPYILSFIDCNKSFKDNIVYLYLDNFAYISRFIETTIKEEISKIEYANSIILAIARGSHKYSDILSKSHIPNNIQMDRALNKLISLGIVGKEVPINDGFNKKKSIYKIEDNAIAFYFKYVYLNQSYLHVMSPYLFFDTFIAKDLEEQYIPHRFEEVCKQYLIRINKLGKINPPFIKIGKYYYDLPKERKNGEFDIVTYDTYGYMSYEVKYRKDPIDEKDVKEEVSSLCSIPLSDSIRVGFFSKSGYSFSTKNKSGFYSLEDIYKI